jgi:hypothetical protein
MRTTDTVARARSLAMLLTAAVQAYQFSSCAHAASAPMARKNAAAAPRTEDVRAAPRTVAANDRWTYRVPLAQLTGAAEPVTLKGAAPQLAMDLPIPALLDPVDVTLNVAGSASGALAEGSQLVVKANGRVVDQFGIGKDEANFRKSVTIPGSALKQGSNDIRLVAAQRSHVSQNSCDADAAPEVWTQIDTEHSAFVVNARPKSVPARLDAMDALFDKSILLPRQTIPMLTAGAPSAAEIHALGIAAQGLGRRYGNVPVTLRHGMLPDNPGKLGAVLPADARGAVMIGTFDKLAAYLEGLALPENAGPIIAVRPLPGDPTRFVLLMAAENEADLDRVATAFAMPGMQWPDEPWLEIRHLELPDVEDAQRMIDAPADPTGVFPLRALQYRTSTLSGKNAAPTELRFWNSNWQGRVLVQVHLSYASGMAPQSALNVLANDVLHGSIPLNSPTGGSYFNYAVTVPAGSLKLGWNVLQFQPVLIPDGTGQGCKAQAQESLAVTLYDDTTVQKYEGAPSKQSDLALLSGFGRSYIDNKAPQTTAVHLGDTDSQTVGAALTLLAKIAQAHRGPLQPAWFGVGESPTAQNHVWIGPQETLPAHVRQAVSPGLPQQVAVQVPLVESGRLSRADGTEWYSALRDNLSFTGENAPVYTHASLDVASLPGHKSYAYTKRANGVTTTVFTAEDRSILAAGIDDITAPGQWTQLRGSLASWTPGAAGVSAISAEEAPFHAYGMRGGLGIVVSRYPWIVLIALGLAISLLVPATSGVIKRYRRRNHGPDEQ